MFPRHTRQLLIAAFPLALAGVVSAEGQDAATAGTLEIRASTPTVTVTAPRVGRELVTLPDLEYAFTVTAGCEDGLAPATVTLSVADTRERVALADDGTGVARLRVPATQLAPIPVSATCAASAEPQHVHGILSAQASLTCSADAGERIRYAGSALGVLLKCSRPHEDSAEDGDAAADAELTTD